MFIATTNEASQRTQDYMKEGLERGSSRKERLREGKRRAIGGGRKCDFNSGKRGKSTVVRNSFWGTGGSIRKQKDSLEHKGNVV